MLISPIGLLEPIQNQDRRIIPGCFRNPYRFIHTKCPLSLPTGVRGGFVIPESSLHPQELVRVRHRTRTRLGLGVTLMCTRGGSDAVLVLGKVGGICYGGERIRCLF